MRIPSLTSHSDGPRILPPDGVGYADGLCSALYLAWRCEEECYRAQRYRAPLTLMVVEVARRSDASPLEEQLPNWIWASMRMTDRAAYLGDGCYAVLLPETGREGAGVLADRLRRAFPQVKTGISVHPQDGKHLEDLVCAARRTYESGLKLRAA